MQNEGCQYEHNCSPLLHTDAVPRIFSDWDAQEYPTPARFQYKKRFLQKIFLFPVSVFCFSQYSKRMFLLKSLSDDICLLLSVSSRSTVFDISFPAAFSHIRLSGKAPFLLSASSKSPIQYMIHRIIFFSYIRSKKNDLRWKTVSYKNPRPPPRQVSLSAAVAEGSIPRLTAEVR